MGEQQITSVQLSYSTADIEKSIFYEAEYTLINPAKPLGEVKEAKIIVVHGEMFSLEEKKEFPQQSIPLTEKSGLFRIIDLAKESEI
jgi:hypothetical protein